MGKTVRRGISVTAVIAAIGALGTLGNQLVDMRGRLIEQQARAMADSVVVNNRFERLERELLKNNGFDQKIHSRVARLERPVQPSRGRGEDLNRIPVLAPAAQSSPGSPGLVQLAGKTLWSPVKWLGGGLRALFVVERRDTT